MPTWIVGSQTLSLSSLGERIITRHVRQVF